MGISSEAWGAISDLVREASTATHYDCLATITGQDVEAEYVLLQHAGTRIGMMGVFKNVLLNAFGRPTGTLGKLGGLIMARTNRQCAEWIVGLLEVQPDDKVLELGFGPGVGIKLLAQAACDGYVFGVDPSKEMVDQAMARNAEAIKSGHVDLRLGSAESLPFADNSFDKAMAINSLQVWPDAIGGLREVRRAIKRSGTVALGFTRNSGQRQDGLIEKFGAAGFANARVVEADQDFCVLATKP